MLYSHIFPKTRREEPRDANTPGTSLLIRAGFIHKAGAAGIWSWTPLGLRVRRRAEQIVREEMDRAGATEVELPILQSRDFWEETGRWEKYRRANISFCLHDRHGQEYMLAPTAEELITEYARAYCRSYQDLPVTFYQMSPKYRDELRPRGGLMRGREFLMKDAYSFGRHEEDMRQAFAAMSAAYKRVFERAGFKFVQVEADSGAIGGSGSAEFMAVAESGEDILIRCPNCGYGANQEKATATFNYPDEEQRPLEKLATPNIRTVEELEEFVNLRADQMVKTLVMVADDHPVVVSLRGDLEISEIKLANLLGAETVETAEDSVVIEVTQAPVGFAGPINLFDRDRIFNGRQVEYYFDCSVEGMHNFLCGGNEEDVHYINVNTDRDFPAPPGYHDLSKACAGLACPRDRCSGKLETSRGIELGHIFQLQKVYSQPMAATYMNEAGERVPFWMGCYGIGVSRMVQAIVEQNYDNKGIVWPWPMAPYQIVIVPANHHMLGEARGIYQTLCFSLGSDEIMLDDRGLRFGEAITDAELIGYPVQIVVGRAWKDGRELEVRLRDQRDKGEYFDVQKNPALKPINMDIDSFVGWFRTRADKEVQR